MAAVLETERSQRRIVSVNGPPGTGKTTLLREFVADQITRRAEAMAAYSKPSDAFRLVCGERENNPVYAPAPDVAGREIVIASSNNRAVENVSDELPSHEAVVGFEDELSHVDAFTDVATEILRARNEELKNAKAWGLIAASLGSKKKRNEFAYLFWKTKQPRPSVLRNGKSCEVTWKFARDNFRVKSECVAALIAERAAVYDEVDRYARTHADTANAQSTAREARQRFSEVMTVVASSNAELALARSDRDAAMRRFDDVRARAPSLLEWILDFFGNRGVRSYRATLRSARDAFAAADAREARARESMESIEATVRRKREDCDVAQLRADELQREVAAVGVILAEHQERLGVIGDDAWWHREHEAIQDAVPLVDSKLRSAQREVFCAAMLVHRVFLTKAWGKLQPTLWNWVDLLGGSSKYRDPSAVAAMWRCAFLVVPVISTTFASVRTMFRGLPTDALGWAVVDEAGQAVPQAAVGLFRRSRRALVVGDPSQIEPVVSLESALLFELRKLGGVRERWVADGEGGASLQTIVDELRRYGTLRDIGGARRWIGVPLFVHRRCLDPMFAISNTIAYEGRMINRTLLKNASDGLPPNAWIDERSMCSVKHVVDEQILLVQQALMRFGAQREQTYVITPFKAVANALQHHLGQIIKRDRIGTIHTFQGKETDIVFLVLGLDANSAHSRWFAYERPNVLNVAVTRAKSRLYIVGDIRVWGGGDNFGCAQRYLSAVTPEQFLASLPAIVPIVPPRVLASENAGADDDP